MRVFNDNFIISKKTKKFILDLYNLMENIPRKDFFIKEKINLTTFDLLENIYLANSDLDAFETHYLNIIKNISILDFLLEILYRKKYISLKQLEKEGYLLTEITKMVKAWKRIKKVIMLSDSLTLENLLNIYDNEISKNVKNKSKLYKFELHKIEYLLDIRDNLLNGKYDGGKYNLFL